MQILVTTDDHTDGGAGLTQQVEDVVNRVLRRFGDRITRVEVHFADDNSRQKSSDDDKCCVMEVRAAGIPAIAVSHKGATLEQALQGAADTLQKTLQRTLGRRDSLLKRRASARAEFTAVDPLLERDAAIGNQEEFLTLLRPLLSHLRDHASRELRILEINGLLPSGQVAAADVLNELMARAWLRFADRPRQISLDLWLMDLLDETLDETLQSESPMKRSMDQPADEVHSEDRPQVDDQEWWVWLLGEDETVSLGDSIAADATASASEQFEARELKERVHSLLAELPKAQRQAFVLHVLEAYDLFEIAMLQDRPETDVRTDIEAARQAIWKQLPAAARLKASAPPAGAEPGDLEKT